MNIEEQITLYPELTGEERAAVEAYVEAHPEWEPALDEAKRWDQLLRDVRMLGQDPSSDEALAYYVASRKLQPERAPAAVAALVRRVEEQIDSDPNLAIRVSEMQSRMDALEQSSPAEEQFERLMRQKRSGGMESGDSPYEPGIRAHREERSDRSPVEERSAGRSEVTSYLLRVAAAIVALVVVYGALYAAGHLMRPPHERLAAFDDGELTLEGYENVRGEGADAISNASIRNYLDALDELRAAESAMIGLFPRFDRERLDSAAILLREVRRMEPAESFLAGEAIFLLGKTELARGNVAAAEQAFSRVVASGGRRAADARRILVELQD